MRHGVNRHEAHVWASNHWGRVARPHGGHYYTVGDRKAFTRLRRKDVADRCEVGYQEYVADSPQTWNTVIMGRGPTWVEAIAAAERQSSEIIIGTEETT